MLSDREIVALLFARSEEAIAALESRFGRLCRRIAVNILHCEEDAEECVSDTYLAVWDSVPPKEPDPLMPYVGRIARNFALDRCRYNRAARRSSDGDVLLSEVEEIVSGGEDAEERVMQEALAAEISAFLRALKADDRHLFVRRYWYGDELAAIAAEMGMRAGSAAVRLHRIRERLREHLTKEGFTL